MTLKKITDRDLQGYGVIGMADAPNLSARQMQEKVEEVVRSVVIPAINRNIDYTASKQDLADAVLNAGAGDMAAVFYDTNGDGIVNKADNGFFIYTHSENSLTGRGENGRFKATAAGTYASFAVNGTSCAVKCGEDTEIELVTDVWYTFILDGNTINFKQGGAGLNFRIVGGTVQPASPKENTIWINTDLEITGWTFGTEAPDNMPAGGVWIKTGVSGNVCLNAVKKKGIWLYPSVARQWDGAQFVKKEMLTYIGGQWVSAFPALIENGVARATVERKGFTTISVNGVDQNKIANSGTISNSGGLHMVIDGYHQYTCAYLDSAVDFTDISTVKLTGSVTKGNASNKYIPAVIFIMPNTDTPLKITANDNGVTLDGAAAYKIVASGVTTETATWSIDTSALVGQYYIGACLVVANVGGNASMTISHIEFE